MSSINNFIGGSNIESISCSSHESVGKNIDILGSTSSNI